MEKQEVPAPQIFDHEQFGQIRGVIIDGEPWLVGIDVARALGYRDPKSALKQHIDDEDKRGCQITTPYGVQNFTVINESGLFSLILRSNLPKAREFKRWVTHEVLPNLRKYGYYALPRQNEIEHPKLNDLTAEKFLKILEAIENYKRAAYDYEAKQERIHELRNELLKLDNECKVLLAKKQDLIGKIDSSMQDFFAELKRNQLHLRV